MLVSTDLRRNSGNLTNLAKDISKAREDVEDKLPTALPHSNRTLYFDYLIESISHSVYTLVLDHDRFRLDLD